VVGAVTQTAEVQAGGVALNTTESTIDAVVGHQDVAALPLTGRTFTELIFLTANITDPNGPAERLHHHRMTPTVNGMRA
jgi:hypothetical protein